MNGFTVLRCLETQCVIIMQTPVLGFETSFPSVEAPFLDSRSTLVVRLVLDTFTEGLNQDTDYGVWKHPIEIYLFAHIHRPAYIHIHT